MSITAVVFGSIIALMAAWGLGATYFFAPDLFANLDVSDILSGIGMTTLAIVGNFAGFSGS